MKSIFVIFISVIVLSGCQQPVPEQALWSGQLQRSDSKSIPFRAFVNLRSQPPSGYFLVGEERIPIPGISRTGDSLSFLFSEYNAAMRGVLAGPTWSGVYVRYRNTTMSIPFHAVVEVPSNEKPSERKNPAIPLVGKFHAFLKHGSGIDSNTVATFWTKNDSIFGTLIAPDGDYGLNAGTQQGTTVSLGRFTGWQAQLFEFTQEGNVWKGTMYVRDDPPTNITLEPRPAFAMDMSGGRVTTIKDRRKPFSFSGITADGDTLSNLSERFKGKAIIVDIMGTWCHNCMDESPLLQQVYSEYKSKGLEVVGLSFEINDNPGQAKRNLRLYQQRYSITFPLLFCGSTDDKYVAAQLRTQLVNFYAYPTTLFIDKKGIVHSIHIGFKGPGTGKEFQAEVNHMYAEVKKITGS